MDEQDLERRLQQLGEGVNEYLRDRALILSELKRFNDVLDRLDGRFIKLDIRLTRQEVKAGLWGVVGGAAAIIVAIYLKFLFSGIVR